MSVCFAAVLNVFRRFCASDTSNGKGVLRKVTPYCHRPLTSTTAQHKISLTTHWLAGISRSYQEPDLGPHHQIVEVIANKASDFRPNCQLLLKRLQLRLLVGDFAEAKRNAEIGRAALNRT